MPARNEREEGIERAVALFESLSEEAQEMILQDLILHLQLEQSSSELSLGSPLEVSRQR